MGIQEDFLPRIKNYIHAAQGSFISISIILTLAVFTQNGHSDGRTAWFFVLCWFSIPIIIYLVAVPMWPRARKFGNVYSFAIFDLLSVIFWLSAWASVASYVSAGKAAGTNDNASGCDNFGFGSAARCKLSEATIFFGVMIMLLFVGTSYISFRAVMQYRRTGMMPSPADANDFAVQTQDAFSSNMRHDDFEEEREVDPRQGARSGYQPQRQSIDDEHALLQRGGHEDISQAYPAQPTGPVSQGLSSPTMSDYDTSYTGGYNGHSPNPILSPGFKYSPAQYGR